MAHKNYPLANELLSQLTVSNDKETRVVVSIWLLEWYRKYVSVAPEDGMTGEEIQRLMDERMHLYHELEAVLVDLASYARPALKSRLDDTEPASMA